MPSAHIRLFPDPVLRKSAAPVTQFDGRLRDLIHAMAKTMEAQKHGIGIAAPQIGVGKRVAIVDVSARVKAAKRWVLINPVILETRQEILSREGCMSLPEYTAYLKRFQWVRAAWQDESGKRVERTAEGIEAVCIQHEIDHLNGILFIDRVASLKTDMMPRQ